MPGKTQTHNRTTEVIAGSVGTTLNKTLTLIAVSSRSLSFVQFKIIQLRTVSGLQNLKERSSNSKRFKKFA